MNLIKISFYAICLTAAFTSCVQNDEFSTEEQESGLLEIKSRNVDDISTETYAPLNVVPDWVKQNVTSEEYELWKSMSSRYEIDYTFLKEGMSEKRKKQVYDYVRKVCTDIQSGKIKEYVGMFVVSSEHKSKPLTGWKLERLTRHEDDNFTTRNELRTMYSHNTNYYTVRVMLSIDYTVNLITYMVSDMNPLFYVDANSELNASYTGTNNCIFDEASKIIHASCGGTVRWTVGEVPYYEDFSTKVQIIP